MKSGLAGGDQERSHQKRGKSAKSARCHRHHRGGSPPIHRKS